MQRWLNLLVDSASFAFAIFFLLRRKRMIGPVAGNPRDQAIYRDRVKALFSRCIGHGDGPIQVDYFCRLSLYVAQPAGDPL